MLLLTFQTVPWLEGWRSNSRCERLCMTNCQFPFVIVFLSNAWLLFLFVGDAVAKAHSGIWKDLQVSLWSPVCCIHCRSRHDCSSPPSRRQSTTKSQHGILAGVQRFTGESHGAHFCVSVVTPPLSLFSCVSLVIFWRTAQVIWEIRLFCVGKSVCLVGGSESVFVVNAVNLSVLLWSFKGMVMMYSWTCSELLCMKTFFGNVDKRSCLSWLTHLQAVLQSRAYQLRHCTAWMWVYCISSRLFHPVGSVLCGIVGSDWF